MAFKDSDQAKGPLLLHGPPGVGKSMMMNAFATHCGTICLSQCDIIPRWGDSGKNEEKLDLICDIVARESGFLCIDEADSIPKKIVSYFQARTDLKIVCVSNVPWELEKLGWKF